MSEKFDTFEIKLESMFKEIKLIKKENEQIKLINERLTKDMNEIKQKIDQLEQNLGVSYIYIYIYYVIGIPKTENENYIKILKSIGQKLNTNVKIIVFLKLL